MNTRGTATMDRGAANENAATIRVAVVIAWVNPFELLVPGLESLQTQQGIAPAEIIVVTRHGLEAQQRFRARFPNVTLLPAASDTSIPIMRSIGMAQATSEVIAVTEDHCVPASDWVSRITEHMRDGCVAVGGPVENACTGRLRDWAAFLTEYAGVIRPADATVTNGIPGNNVAYRRDLLDGLRHVLEEGRWESFYHERLVGKGVQIVFDRDLVVHHRRPFDFWYFLRQRFYFCRSFAAMRLPGFSTLDRVKYSVGSVLLPPLLFMRALGNLRQRGRFVGCYLACSPLIALYFVAGAAGEMVGYFCGGGHSLEKVE